MGTRITSWQGLWTSDSSLGAHWSGWGPAQYAFSLFLSLCLYFSIFSVSLPLPSSVFLCLSIYPSVYLFTCLCFSPFLSSLFLSVSLPFSSHPLASQSPQGL